MALFPLPDAGTRLRPGARVPGEDCAVRERVRALADLAGEIRARPCAGAARLVAVDGRGGAGKSTLARMLAAACGGAPVVRVDDFLYWRDIEGWWPRLEREALRPLLSGIPGPVPRP